MKELFTLGLPSYIKKKYIDCSLMMVTGSFLNENYNEFSDIDIVIFTENRNVVFNETFFLNEKKVQAIIIPISRIEEIIWADYMNCNGAIINMISSGKPIIDKNNYLLNLIDFTSSLYKRGGRRLNIKEIKHNLTYISSLLNDIKGNKNIYENLICINELTDKTVELYLKSEGLWAGKGKYRMKSFKKYLPNLYQSLIDSHKDIFLKENIGNFISFIDKCLNSFSGEINSFSFSNFFNHKSDFYVIQTNSSDNDDVISFFIKSNINYFYYSHHSLIGNNTKESLYIIIPIYNQFEFDEIENVLNKKALYTFKSSKYPIDFNPFLRLGVDTDTNNIISDILIKLKDLININKINNEEFKIILSNVILKLFITNIIDNDVINEFTSYLYDELIVLSTDNILINQSKLFQYNRKSIISKINTQYLNQKNELEIIFSKEDDYNLNSIYPYLIEKFKIIKNSNDLFFYRKNKFKEKNKENFQLNKELLITILRGTTLDINKITYVFHIYKNINI